MTEREKMLAGVAYAPSQAALGDWSNTPRSRPGAKHDNLYLWADASSGIPGTPITESGLNANGSRYSSDRRR